VQGTLGFAGAADEPLTTCPWFLRQIQGATANPPVAGTAIPTTAFDATIAYPDAGTVNLCLLRTLAEPKAGTRAGDAIVLPVASEARAATGVGNCRCPVNIVESFQGTLTRTGGPVTGFSGELLARISRTPAAPCYDDPAQDLSDCPASGGSCDVHYTMHAP